jgi:hypothetical protein
MEVVEIKKQENIEVKNLKLKVKNNLLGLG